MHKDFSPIGTNVNFIQIKNDEISIRTFERGVEQETLACGTGSVAAAIIVNAHKNLKSTNQIKNMGRRRTNCGFSAFGR